MHRNQRTLEIFYTAFARLDAQTMADCYAPGAQFEDEAFSLRGQKEVASMWRMLCSSTKAKGAEVWNLSYSGVHVDDKTGNAHWEANYRFSATGRMVHNVIDSAFEFNPQGLITRHSDRFNFWAWARQALGPPGLLLGWTPFFHQKVRTTAAANLKNFLATHAS